jgi:hypothetical protein
MDKRGRAPIPQKARPLALFITGGNPLGGLIGGILGAIPGLSGASMSLPFGMAWGYIFFLRPEEVAYTHPTRATVIQTLGGAWVDDFGEGLTEITLSGHTGWRPGETIPIGGEEAFLLLRKGCFELYHNLRMEASRRGRDPDTVQMLFVDTLNTAVYVVYPTSLGTRKHRSRPLLFQYQLKLIGLNRLI